MLAPFSSWIPVTVFVASILGSVHCAGMCGGLASLAGGSRRQLLAYHLGRLGGYLGLGAIGGALGAATLGAEQFAGVSWAATALLGWGLIQMGVRVWRGGAPHFSVVPRQWLHRLHAWARGRAWVVGLLSAFLPCGWLHGFVLASVAAQNPVRGALVLLMFWLGTLPALSTAPWLFKRAISPVFIRAPRVAAVLLIGVGILSVALRSRPLLIEAGAPSGGGTAPVATCHQVGHAVPHTESH